MISNFDFWKGKKVFLTGHTGFKGSWLSLWLNLLGAEVTGYSKDIPTEPALFDQAKINKLVNDCRGDINDLESLSRVMKVAQPEIVIHMAAQPLVRESYDDPLGTYETNVMGTLKVLECIRNTPSVKSVVIITTDKCYENREWFWGYRENEAMGGYDPYSSSKGCVELLVSSYRRSYFNSDDYGKKHHVALATARAGNVIGGGDWAKDRLIPDIIRAIISKEKVKIRNPQAIRPWQHVLEPLHGYLILAQALYDKGIKFAQAWNFGPLDFDTKSVGWIAKRICELWGEGAYFEQDNNNYPHEANYLKLDIAKARQKLDWKPMWDIDLALCKITEWNKALLHSEDVYEICIKQIRDFECLMIDGDRS